MLMTLVFNLMIERRFGVPLVRRRSLFVTGDISRAAKYAPVHDDNRHIGVVEPVGAFHYLYSPLIHDSYGMQPELELAVANAFNLSNPNDFLNWFADPATATMNELEAIRQRYLAEHSVNDWLAPTDPFQLLLRDLDVLVERFKYRLDDRLEEASSLGVEVMLYDCPDGCHIRPVDESALSRVAPVPRCINPLLTVPKADRVLNLLCKSVAFDIDHTLATQPDRINFFRLLTEALIDARATVLIISREADTPYPAIRQRLIESGIKFSRLLLANQMKKKKWGGSKTLDPNLLPSATAGVIDTLCYKGVSILVSDDATLLTTFRKEILSDLVIAADRVSELSQLLLVAQNQVAEQRESVLAVLREIRDTRGREALRNIIDDIGMDKLPFALPDDLMDALSSTT